MNNYQSSDFEYDPDKKTEVKVIMEFLDNPQSCVGISLIHNVLFVLRNFRENNKLNLKLYKLNHKEYTEIQDYVDGMLQKRPPVDQFVDKNVLKQKLLEKYKDFKVPNFKPVKLSGKEGQLTERDFLKQFTKQANDLSINVVSEMEEFHMDIEARVKVIKALKIEEQEKQCDIESHLDLIKQNQTEFHKGVRKVQFKDSEIKKKIENITRKLLDKITAPLSKREEIMLQKINNISDQANNMNKTIQNQIEDFKDQRIREEEIMKDYKVKFSQETIETQIMPKIKRLQNVKNDLQKYRAIVEEYKNENRQDHLG